MFPELFCVLSCSLMLYCCDPHEQITEIVEPQNNATSAVIFLHGAGESGSVLRKRVENKVGPLSQMPNTRFIFPTAFAFPFDPFPWLGQITNVWYNADANKLDTLENFDHIDQSAALITEWVEAQVASGIPHNRICVVGFSSGGFMALHYGYEYMKNLGCVGVISAYLSTSSGLYKKMTAENRVKENLPPLYITGGKWDILVVPSWTTFAAEVLEKGGVATTLFIHGGSHPLEAESLERLFKFINNTIG